LLWDSVGQILFVPVIVALGWTYEINFVYPVVLGFFNGFFFTFPRPGLTTYAIEIGGKFAKHQAPSTITGLIYACMYLTGGLASQLSVYGRTAFGVGIFFTGCATLATLALIPVVVVMVLGMRKERRALLAEELPLDSRA